MPLSNSFSVPLLYPFSCLLHRLFAKARPGTLMKMLFSILEANPDYQQQMFQHFVNPQDYQQLFGCGDQLPLPQLVPLVSNFGWKDNLPFNQSCNISNVKYGNQDCVVSFVSFTQTFQQLGRQPGQDHGPVAAPAPRHRGRLQPGLEPSLPLVHLQQ